MHNFIKVKTFITETVKMLNLEDRVINVEFIVLCIESLEEKYSTQRIYDIIFSCYFLVLFFSLLTEGPLYLLL